MAITTESLPLQPSPDQKWSEYCGAYNIVLEAERHAEKQLTINPSGQEEKANLVFARVTDSFLSISSTNTRSLLKDLVWHSHQKLFRPLWRELPTMLCLGLVDGSTIAS